MGLPFFPRPGLLVIFDFQGFVLPEMVKPRLCVVISPKRNDRQPLSTIVPLSTTDPHPVMKYHCKLSFPEPITKKFSSTERWVKGDLVYTLAHSRLNLPCDKDSSGKRNYVNHYLSDTDLRRVRECVAFAIGLNLTATP